MIQLEVKVCSIDHCPISTSKAYKKLHKLDPAAAEKTVYLKLIPGDDG